MTPKGKCSPKPIVRLVQLQAPPPAALGQTGNAALSPGCLAVAAQVGGLTKKFDIDVILPQISDTFGDTTLADHLATDNPAILGFSLYMWNIERSLHIAREVLRRSPDTTVVVGGPEVQPDNAFLLKQQGFDLAVAGEGEEVFAEILARSAAGEPLGDVPSTAFRTEVGMGLFTPGKPPAFPIKKFPSPYLKDVIPIEAGTSVYIETVRGCASRCAFCFYSRGSCVVRRLGAPDAGKLISRLAEAGARHFTVLDPSFNLRPDFVQLLEAIAKTNRKQEFSFFAEVRAEALTEKQMDLLVKAGFTKLEAGLQSVNARTLARAKRGGDPEAVIKACEKLKARGIELLVDLMIGLPGDTRYDVHKAVETLRNRGLGEFVQMMPLSVLPGTSIRENAAEEGIVFEEAPPYRVIRTDKMSEADISESILMSEDILDRRLDEYPRPFLVSPAETVATPDVLTVNLDSPESEVMQIVSVPCSRHVAMWLDSSDLFARRGLIGRIIERRVAVDPYCTLDVVLIARQPFPLDLVDLVRNALAKWPEWYLTRHLAQRGENAARRVSAVIPSRTNLPGDYVESLMAELPVFKDMTTREAAKHPELLGDKIPAARITDTNLRLSNESLKKLARSADPEAVTFASRRIEAWWVKKVL